jgi:hypothetical protein
MGAKKMKVALRVLSIFALFSILMTNINTLFAQDKSTNASLTTPKMEEKKDNATKKEEPKKKKREIGC